MSKFHDLCEVRVVCPIGRFYHSHVSIVLDLSHGAPGFDLRHEVVLESRENWRAVRLDVAQMPWGVIVRSPVMVVVLVAELGRIVIVRVPSIKVRMRSGDDPWFDELCSTAFLH